MTAEATVAPETTSKRWENLGPRTKDFFTHVIGQVRIIKKAYPGIMHFMLFWGVGIQVVGTHHQPAQHGALPALGDRMAAPGRLPGI